jgi:hypothetical protein
VLLQRPLEPLKVEGEGLTWVGWEVLAVELREARQPIPRLHGCLDGILRGEDVLGR